MPKKPAFNYRKTPSGWKVEIPERLSPSGKRQRVFFPTRDEAKEYAAELRESYDEHGVNASVIAPSLADEAVRAEAMLKPLGITILEAARMAVEAKNRETSSCEISQALDGFLATKQQRSTTHSKAYGYMKRDLLESFQGRMLSSITAEELLIHAEWAAPTPAGFNALARLIRAFWRWCAKHPRGWCEAALVEVLEPKEAERSEIGVLNAAQCVALLQAAQRHHPECVPGFAISLFTGLRKSELGRLTKSDVTPEGINLPAASAKTKRRRFIHMPASLAAWLESHPIADTVLPANWHKKEKAVRRLAGWRVWTDLVEPHEPPEELPEWPHNALRHTHASIHVALGKPLDALTFEFGHSGGSQMLKSHYVGVMPKAEAQMIMRIKPAQMKFSATNMGGER